MPRDALPKKVRWFIVTQWNVDCNYKELVGKDIRWLTYGEEICPKSGRPHHQMFMYLRGNVTHGRRALNKMGDWFGPVHCSVRAMRGRLDENEYYCSKEGYLKEFGVKPKMGARGDLDDTKEAIMKGDLTVDEIAVENPQMFHMYGRTMERVEDIALRQRYRTEMTRGTWYCGPTSAGKSHACFEGFDPDTHYVKPLGDADLKWWDGYKGQETVIFNEFRGQVQFAELLDLMDKWPKTVSRRGREPVPFLAKRLLISSIRHPADVYVHQEGEPWGQFERRCSIVELAPRNTDGPLRQSVLAATARAAKVIRGAQEVILNS